MATTSAADGSGEAAELASLLWQVRESLEAVQSQSAAPGRTAELEHLNGLLLLCATQADALGERLGRAPGATLAELAGAVGDPWQTILSDHRDALRAAIRDADQTGGPHPPALTDFLA